MVGKLDLLGPAIKHVYIRVFLKIKRFANEYSSILLGKVWETGNLMTFSVLLISFYWYNYEKSSKALRFYNTNYSYIIISYFELDNLLVINKNIIKLLPVFMALHTHKLS